LAGVIDGSPRHMHCSMETFAMRDGVRDTIRAEAPSDTIVGAQWMSLGKPISPADHLQWRAVDWICNHSK
jgi:hypothetical protein